MGNKKGLVIALVALAALIGLAAVAYNALGGGGAAQQMSSSAAKEQADKLLDADKESGLTGEAGASDGTSSTSDSDTEELAIDALDFTVLDQSGSPVKLSSMKGKPTVLSFWATWCPPCMQETAAVDALYKKHGSDVNFMMVNITDGSRETQESVSKWYGESGVSYPIFFDTELEASTVFRVQVLPTTFIFDASGELVGMFQGPMDEEQMEKEFELLS